VLCSGLNPNWSSRISPRSFTSCKILANRIFSNNLPIVSRRLMCRFDDGRAGWFPGLSIEITRACFHAVGKWWVRRMADHSGWKIPLFIQISGGQPALPLVRWRIYLAWLAELLPLAGGIKRGLLLARNGGWN
jgi:hypothetical protein